MNSFHSILIHAFHILTLSKHPQTNIGHGCFHPDCSRNDCRDCIIGISISNCNISPGWEVSADTPWLTLNIRFSLRKTRLFLSISLKLIFIKALCKLGWIQPQSGSCVPRSGAHQHHLFKVVSMFSISLVLTLSFCLMLATFATLHPTNSLREDNLWQIKDATDPSVSGWQYNRKTLALNYISKRSPTLQVSQRPPSDPSPWVVSPGQSSTTRAARASLWTPHWHWQGKYL